MESRITDLIDEHIAVADRSRVLIPSIEQLIELTWSVLTSGGKLLLCGNGGSAADCQHIATELTIRFERNRQALAAIALTTDTSALTAAVNDFGADYMFARQVEALGRPGDILIGITTSGSSPNVVSAFKTARNCGLKTVCLTGRDGGASKDIADLSIVVPSSVTARIQEVHILVGHILCSGIEALVEKENAVYT